MDFAAAVKKADKFLRDYARENAYFATDDDVEKAQAIDPEDDMPIVLAVFNVQKKRGQENVIGVTFTKGEHLADSDPRPEKLAKQCVEALVKKHPDVGKFEIDYTVRKP